MYGSIRKSYGVKKASRDNDKKERKMFFSKKKIKERDLEQDEFQETSYMSIDGARKSRAVKPSKISSQQSSEKNTTPKSEFPIASVILTIVFTMMVMVLAFGFGGI